MSTLVPRPPYTHVELAALYPPQLRLQQVQILLRHGERTPVKPRFANAGLTPFWPYCSAVRQLRNSLLDPDALVHPFSVLEWKRRLETTSPHDDGPLTAAGPDGQVDDICDMGMLTDRGRETTYRLGQRLRSLYVDQLGFLPAALHETDSDLLHLRSTAVPRAVESLQQVLHGLYPPHTRAENLPPLTIVSRVLAEETLFPNEYHCRRFAILARAFAHRAAKRWNDTDDMAYLTRKLGKWMPVDDSSHDDANQGPRAPRVAVDSHPRLSGIMDTINSTAAHGPATRLPREFYDPKAKQIMERIAVEEWFAGYEESEEYRTLGIGGLLGDIVQRMVESSSSSSSSSRSTDNAAAAHAPPRPRLRLSGCHDTTIAGTLASLGALDRDAWPPFTSHIAIELFQHRAETETETGETTVGGGGGGDGNTSWWSRTPSLVGSPSRDEIGRTPTPELSEAQKRRLQGWYVRIRYNDRAVRIPGCGA
ncbi:hypothetical protein E4U54_001172, partial [Claviceps lovelessii]